MPTKPLKPRSKAASLSSKAWDAAKDVASATEASAGKVLEQTAQAASSAAGMTAELTSKAFDAAKGVAGATGTAAEKAMEQTAQAASSAASMTADLTAKTFDAAKTVAGSTGAAAGKVFEQTAQACEQRGGHDGRPGSEDVGRNRGRCQESAAGGSGRGEEDYRLTRSARCTKAARVYRLRQARLRDPGW